MATEDAVRILDDSMNQQRHEIERLYREIDERQAALSATVDEIAWFLSLHCHQKFWVTSSLAFDCKNKFIPQKADCVGSLLPMYAGGGAILLSTCRLYG